MTFENVKEFVEKDAPLKFAADGTEADQKLQVAATALMLNAANASSGFSKEELNKVLRSLFRAFHVEGENAADLIAVAEAIMAKPGKMADFIGYINAQFSVPQKEYLLSMIWSVLIADRLAEKAETAFAIEIRKSLKLTLEQAVRARQMAEIQDIPVPAQTGGQQGEDTE